MSPNEVAEQEDSIPLADSPVVSEEVGIQEQPAPSDKVLDVTADEKEVQDAAAEKEQHIVAENAAEDLLAQEKVGKDEADRIRDSLSV